MAEYYYIEARTADLGLFDLNKKVRVTFLNTSEKFVTVNVIEELNSDIDSSEFRSKILKPTSIRFSGDDELHICESSDDCCMWYKFLLLDPTGDKDKLKNVIF